MTFIKTQSFGALAFRTILGNLAVLFGGLWLAFVVVFTIIVGGAYRLFVHPFIGLVVDNPFVYVSSFWHFTTTWVFYYGMLGVRVRMKGRTPVLPGPRDTVLVAGAHPFLWWIPVYYATACRYSGLKLLPTMKNENKRWPVGMLMSIPLIIMGSVIFLRRGLGVSTRDTLADLTAGIRRFRKTGRVLVMHTDGHRPRASRAERDRELYSRILRERYGIDDDLSWLRGSFPRIDGFRQAIFALPPNGRVFLLFMRDELPEFASRYPTALVGARVTFEFVEFRLSTLKKAYFETPQDWDARLMRLLYRTFKDYYLGAIA